jgi:hypothetical protein
MKENCTSPRHACSHTFDLTCDLQLPILGILCVALPQLVTALVHFYGGFLVQNGDMISRKLLSFLLYLITKTEECSGNVLPTRQETL